MNAIYNDFIKREIVETMKNLFLYLKPLKVEKRDIHDIYYFNNDRIVAIDKNIYSRKERASLQDDLMISPFYLTYNIFMQFIYFALNHKEKINLKLIRFEDSDVHDTHEYQELIRVLNQYDNGNVFLTLQELLELYDTYIQEIDFKYKGYLFRLSEQGVIDTEATDDILASFVSDEEINKLILG